MKKELEFPGCILVHTISGTTHLLDGPRDLMDLMDGDCLDDACMDEGRKTLPTDPGVYSATIEYWFQQGYFEGYPAPGESDYDFRLSNLRRIDLSRTPAPVEVERLVDDLLSVSKQLGQSEARGLYDHIEPAEVAINDLKSRLLAALTQPVSVKGLVGEAMGCVRTWIEQCVVDPQNVDEEAFQCLEEILRENTSWIPSIRKAGEGWTQEQEN